MCRNVNKTTISGRVGPAAIGTFIETDSIKFDWNIGNLMRFHVIKKFRTGSIVSKLQSLCNVPLVCKSLKIVYTPKPSNFVRYIFVEIDQIFLHPVSFSFDMDFHDFIASD